MAEKRYYWLKTQEDFFKDPKIKKLRSIAGGDTYTIIYQKMMLLSIRNEGVLVHDGLEEDFGDELAYKIDEDSENIKVVLNFLSKYGLLESNGKEHLLPEASKNIGTEADSTERTRLWRERKKTKSVTCDESVTVPLISKSISISNKDILELFNKLYKQYPRKVGRELGLKTFTKKIKGLTPEEAAKKVMIIFELLKSRIENDWANREKQYIPHFSSWLNSEVPDNKGGK